MTAVILPFKPRRERMDPHLAARILDLALRIRALRIWMEQRL